MSFQEEATKLLQEVTDFGNSLYDETLSVPGFYKTTNIKDRYQVRTCPFDMYTNPVTGGIFNGDIVYNEFQEMETRRKLSQYPAYESYVLDLTVKNKCELLEKRSYGGSKIIKDMVKGYTVINLGHNFIYIEMAKMGHNSLVKKYQGR